MTERNRRKLRDKIVAGVKSAVGHAIEEHRKAGRAVPVLRGGRIVKIIPEPAGEMVLREKPKRR